MRIQVTEQPQNEGRKLTAAEAIMAEMVNGSNKMSENLAATNNLENSSAELRLHDHDKKETKKLLKTH